MKFFLCVIFISGIFTRAFAGGWPVFDAVNNAAQERLNAIQQSSWYQQLMQMTEQVKVVTETLETVEDQLDVAEEALDRARELNEYVGDPSKILGKFKGKFVSPELAEFAETLQDTIENGEDLYDQYNDVKEEWEATIDKYKKYGAVEEIYESTVESKKDITTARKEILNELKKLGEDAANADTDIEVQKTETAIEATKASLEVLNAEERSIQDHLVNQHLRNENYESQMIQRDIDLLNKINRERRNLRSFDAQQ